MSTIRVWNLTDVETPELKRRSAVGITIAVGRALVPPGEAVDTDDDAMTRAHLQYYVRHGIAALNVLPPSYALAKERQQAQKQREEAIKKAEPSVVEAESKKSGKQK